MTAEPTPKTEDTLTLRDSRETVKAIQFFIDAMATQLDELDRRLARAELIATESDFEARLLQIEGERDQARQEIENLQTRLHEAEQEMAKLQEELVRQHVTFADHHAAKQEIARLRGELAALQESEPPELQSEQSQKRWWRSGKS